MGRIEALQQRWEAYRPTKAQAIWLAIICVFATLVLGFSFAGWVTGGTAEKMATDAATTARNELAAAVCADRFMHGENADARLAKLNSSGWWERSELVSSGGWATMPDRKEPNSAVAYMCASLLTDKKA
jgi:hypothetical protein